MANSDRFYDGQTARPHDVDFGVSGDVLILRDRQSHRQLTCWTIAEMRAVDSNVLNGEMTFRHGLYPEQRLILSATASRDRLLDQATHLRHWKRYERLVVGRTIGALALGGLAIILGCYFGLPKLAVALVDHMPQEWDSKLGDPIRRSILHQKASCTGAAGQAAIDQLGARLQPPTIATLPLTIDVVQVEDINAFALPGNHIVVFAGLIAKAETPEMLAGVLAHEMGHLEMRHPTRGVIEQMGLAAAINLLAGNNAISNLGQVMAGLSYTRDMERQADERAIALLHRADIRADGLAGFFEVLKREEKLHLPALLSDHPGLDDRVSATKQDASGGPAMSAADWQAIKSMCGSPK